MPMNGTSNKSQPNWDEINRRKRGEIIKGMSANQLWQFLCEAMSGDFEDFLRKYEELYPKLLRVNMKLLMGEGDE